VNCLKKSELLNQLTSTLPSAAERNSSLELVLDDIAHGRVGKKIQIPNATEMFIYAKQIKNIDMVNQHLLDPDAFGLQIAEIALNILFKLCALQC
jgi:hypothetical protein